ncbi:(2Fe-2S) ferredoxin domain-containing protein [Sphingomonas endolithica]|uniref:(2Fe-2S) ferredoxin domain-containing protein n=1 Tax=Sphingomonas endolithica TaxID=2972485 RepID=UPI0021B036EE|nr:(2Fe-2S) ferredoxin domain-containing protein [Sphingomonas sp. ZFBP2030]
MEARGLRAVPSNWSDTLLVCGKCSKKLGGGFGPKGKTTLGRAMRRELGLAKGRKAALGIVEVKCLGICPKGAVTVLRGSDPHNWSLVPAGADVAEVTATLRPEQR